MQAVYGGADAFDALVYGTPSQSNLDYFQGQLNRLIATPLVNVSNTFIERANVFHDQFNGTGAMRVINAALRAVGNVFRADIIQLLPDIGSMQRAPYQMQRWLMAEPNTRREFISGRCEGYGEAYIDLDPGVIGKRHSDWRRVNDGMVYETDQSDTESDWVATMHFDELQPGDRHLTTSEQHLVVDTWGFLKNMMERKEDDPTSSWNATL